MARVLLVVEIGVVIVALVLSVTMGITDLVRALVMLAAGGLLAIITWPRTNH